MRFKTVEAAARLMTSHSRDTWALADALLADVPERERGGDQRSNATRDAFDLPQALAAIAIELDESEIVTPTGDSYSVDSLRTLRQTALAWPEHERHVEAAYRTHQEIGQSATKREVLSALCAYARGDKPKRPTDVEPASWKAALLRIDAGKGKRRFPVTANDVRVALDRKPNVPGNDDVDTPLALVAQIHSHIADWRRRFQLLEMNEPAMREYVEALHSAKDAIEMMIADVEGVSDDQLEALLEGDQR